jgi:hypothetical protein
VPSPHQARLSNTSSRENRERCVVRWGSSEPDGPRWGRNSAEPGGQQRTAGDNEPGGQWPFTALGLGGETAGLGFHTAAAIRPPRPGAASFLSVLVRGWLVAGPTVRVNTSRGILQDDDPVWAGPARGRRRYLATAG